MGSVYTCCVFKCELLPQVVKCDLFPQGVINNKALMYSRAKSMRVMITVLCNFQEYLLLMLKCILCKDTYIFFSTQNGGISITVRDTRELEFVRETSGTGCQI